MAKSPTWNPITSPQTRLVEKLNEHSIYSHTNRRVSGNFITVRDADNWAAYATIEDARTGALRNLEY